MASVFTVAPKRVNARSSCGSTSHRVSEAGRKQFHMDAEVTCVIYSYEGDRPAIFYESEQVRRLAELRAALNVDLYIL